MKINHKVKNTIKVLFVAMLAVVAVSYRTNHNQQVVSPMYATSGSDTSGSTDTLGMEGVDTLAESPADEPAWMMAEPVDVQYVWMKTTDSLRKNLSGTKKDLVLALNRVSENRIRRLDSLIVPDTVTADFMAYSPFPFQLDSASEIEKLIVFDYRIQAFSAYEKGKLVRWGPVSMGSKGRLTPTGMYHTNYHKKRKISTVDDSWIMDWYFNIMNFEGIGMHEYSLPGYPASHGCLRLLENDAYWIYNWADQWRLTPDGGSVTAYGTPVLIYGAYDFEGPRPWHELVNDPHANDIPADSLNLRLSEHLDKILKRQTKRDSVLVARGDI
ncbi:L,D-transpeptidase [Telluribacter humicola]|uniref:L,D-transpeptidase n=1 Tax=Telluribacter humicola TaxID=1720261 RepID=UPI001A9673FC|nr:L,D-transpeptidase [Telluribacter humicola]